MQANAARLAYRYCRHQLRSPSAREDGDFSLPEPLNGASLAPKLTESGECRLRQSVSPMMEQACIGCWLSRFTAPRCILCWHLDVGSLFTLPPGMPPLRVH